MGDVEAGLAPCREDRLRRRRRGGDELDLAVEARRFSSSGVDQDVAMTIGAPQRCVTLCSASASQIGFGRTQRRQTCVPATTEIDHGKHQPLQWNIGSVHR